ncbi:coiled-coil domain-containing protein [Frigoriglobus tundricola]|uniref:Uncharacterized protein n=1 Tax=Frigoriglobus tundricola TaxID=2774151 RepID=A0A6M5YNY6_9BACT|nr:hypothetical protein [Frigoriglobus tundricola]QJW95204.1 hypothetical protein FTUN_2746 [Frigoriglobus tundricola]
MADTRQRTTWGSRFRFLVRAVGLTGVAAVGVGGMLAAATLPAVDFGSWPALQTLHDLLRVAANGDHGELAKGGAWALACGAGAVAVALVVELLGALLLGVGRRTAAGTAATGAVAAAVALLGVVNVYSFTHYGRYDCTRDRRFTLKPELVAELGTLRASSPTTIVVLQKHRMFGTLSDERDSYTKAAEEKVAEKVQDLVDQFREFGPQFHVTVLDSEAFGYGAQLKALTADAPELKAAITSAPENSIFFHANKRVQRLAFNEFLQLDKTASREADGGRANLVLLPQGVETFARRVLAVQERRPKAAVCVVHELLTTVADNPKNRFALTGLRKSLAAQGFEVVDIVLKKNWNSARSPSDLKPAADTREESKLERLEGELEDAEIEIASARMDIKQVETIRDLANKLKGRPWEERKAFYQRITRGTPTEEREPNLLAQIAARLKRAQDELEEATKKKQEADKKLTDALKDERPLQDRRMSDVSAKLTRQLADVDLLIVPRYTTEDAMQGPGIDAGLHALSKEQAKVAKDFMKRGKPVLACLGPITPQVNPQPGESADEFDKRLAGEFTGADEFEKMLAERGVELGRTVILFEGETKALTRGGQIGTSPSEVPAVTVAEPPAADSGLGANPIAAAFRLTGRTAAPEPDADARATDRPDEQRFEIKLRALRPVALAPAWQAKQPFAAEIALTAAGSWNTLQPYPVLDRTGRPARVPKYNPTGLDDPKKGTRDEERKGPFPIAVALENRVPAAWVTEEYEPEQAAAALLAPLDGTFATGLTVAANRLDRPTQRTVVFGSGTMFNATKLTPPEEKLLLHTVNWLTNREDRLPKAATAGEPEWHYPRVAMTERDRLLWRFGTAVGLPMVAAYGGLLAMMRRRMR